MDKIDRLLDAIEHPDRYSEQELEAMLADPEVREVYDTLDKTKASLTPITAPDVDAEWTAFSAAHRNTQKRNLFPIFNLLSRNIAASIAIGIASLAAVAAVVGVSVNYALNYNNTETANPEVAKVENVVIASNDTIAVAGETPVAVPETIVFDNEPLETIANRIAEYYGYKAEFSTDAPKALRLYFRWNQAHTLDEVVESLNNFEQIHLTINDNTIKID